MFTGIIQACGTIAQMEQRDGDVRLTVKAPHLPWQDVQLGDSIATNGVCLTAVELHGDGFSADASTETLRLTTLGTWAVGTAVNLEKALTPESRLGGHIVSGHVDGVGHILSRTSDARSEQFSIRAPKALAKYIAHKGSITVDGISLTVNAVNGDTFELTIVPHTLQHTIMSQYASGSSVNLEVDVIARYLERLLLGDKAAIPASNITEAFLNEHGYGNSSP